MSIWIYNIGIFAIQLTNSEIHFLLMKQSVASTTCNLCGEKHTHLLIRIVPPPNIYAYKCQIISIACCDVMTSQHVSLILSDGCVSRKHRMVFLRRRCVANTSPSQNFVSRRHRLLFCCSQSPNFRRPQQSRRKGNIPIAKCHYAR